MKVKLTFIIRAAVVEEKQFPKSEGAGVKEGKLFEFPFYETVKTFPANRFKMYMERLKKVMAGFARTMDTVSLYFGGK